MVRSPRCRVRAASGVCHFNSGLGFPLRDGYAWFMESGTAESTTETGFEPLAARQLILGLSGNLNGSVEE
ncbi:MAG: hypothetical protein F6K50_34795, partial [Moorea sp. SIO3I7]|nr:hypothetical protein [Moorena sp. SIO3I7]